MVLFFLSKMPSSSNNHQRHLVYLLFSATIFGSVISVECLTASNLMFPFNCSDRVQTCNSYLHHHSSDGLSIEQIASYYSVNTSDIQPFARDLKQDYLVSVPCTCKDVGGTLGYFYDTFYKVRPGDTFVTVASMFYNGQAWKVAGEEKLFPGNMIRIHLLCACTEVESQDIVTYTVQANDTLWGISELLSANWSGIESLNRRLIQSPSFIVQGWVLFVPRERKGTPKQGKSYLLTIVLPVLSAVTLFSICAFLLVLLHRRNRTPENRAKDQKTGNQCPNPVKTPLRSHFINMDIEDVAFESERPVEYSLEEIDQATNNFDESRKIGEGGYGGVYIGLLRDQEVAIKKMKSNRSKEFFSELKVLCKIHHINVVELLGYASEESHLYLVYEYMHNGSLNDHLHNPLLKGHSPLPWTARAHVALDAARGIEYIHDHTKAQYVHRDIKTSNILLDQAFRAKVADFGLARLVERSREEDVVATQLVGTPGYIAPESLRELQMTSKTDVFAFGVVLAELITGQRALARDSQEPNKIKALVSLMLTIFRDRDPETALEPNIDLNLRGIYPIEEVYKMAEISRQCLSEDPKNRPEMREIVQELIKIFMAAVEWEASLAGSTQDSVRVIDGR